MADLVISKVTFDKYSSNGKLRLTAGAIQRMMEGPMEKHSVQYVVQVLNYRKGALQWDNQENYHLVSRMRLSDGVFQFAGVVVEAAMEQRLDSDRFEGKGSNEIIVVKSISLTSSLKLKRDQENSMTIIIHDYELLSRGNDQITIGGDGLRSHPGEKETHMGYKPSGIGEVEWHECRKFAVDDKLSGPPAAKRAKDNSGAAVGGRTAPPPASRSKSGGETGLTPIAMVTPYLTKFRIGGICTAKEDIRTIPAKNMKVFNFELSDKAGSTIRISSFNEAAEALYNTVHQDCCYYVSGGTVKGANKRFNSTGHDYEITVRNEGDVKLSNEVIEKPVPTFKFCPLNNIVGFLEQQIDVLAVVDVLGTAEQFTSKAGRELVKRDLKLIDKSETEVTMTMWNDAAKNFDESLIAQVIAVKNVLVKEFQGGYTLSTVSSTKILPSPNMPEVVDLYNWYETDRGTADIKKLAGEGPGIGGNNLARDLRFISTIEETQFGRDQPEYANVKASITMISTQNMIYKACASDGCLKKVLEVDGDYRCEKCNITGPNFKYNYMMNFEISDATGNCYVTAFSQLAEKIMKHSADELGTMKDTDPERFNIICQQPLFKPHMFRIRAKFESYNDEVKQRFTAVEINDIKHDAYQEQLKLAIEKLELVEEYNDE